MLPFYKRNKICTFVKTYKIMDKKKLVAATKKSILTVTKYTVRQKRCWALVAQKLNEYIPFEKVNEFWEDKDLKYLEKYVPFNRLGEFVMELDPSNIVSKGKSIRPTLEKLLKEDITMSDNESCQLGFSFLSYYEIQGGKCFLGLSARCVRWVLGINRDNLFSTFHIGSFMRLSSSITMDVYLYISGHYNQPQWTENVEDLRKRLSIPDSYNVTHIRSKVLDASISEFSKIGALLSFSYTFVTEIAYMKKGRKAVSEVKFSLFELKGKDYSPVVKQEKHTSSSQKLTSSREIVVEPV